MLLPERRQTWRGRQTGRTLIDRSKPFFGRRGESVGWMHSARAPTAAGTGSGGQQPPREGRSSRNPPAWDQAGHVGHQMPQQTLAGACRCRRAAGKRQRPWRGLHKGSSLPLRVWSGPIRSARGRVSLIVGSAAAGLRAFDPSRTKTFHGQRQGSRGASKHRSPAAFASRNPRQPGPKGELVVVARADRACGRSQFAWGARSRPELTRLKPPRAATETAVDSGSCSRFGRAGPPSCGCAGRVPRCRNRSRGCSAPGSRGFRPCVSGRLQQAVWIHQGPEPTANTRSRTEGQAQELRAAATARPKGLQPSASPGAHLVRKRWLDLQKATP